MLVKREEVVEETREAMRNGPGSVVIQNLLKKEQYPPHCRLLAPLVLKKGCGIGLHPHTGEAELYYVMEGEGIYTDNGVEKPFLKGDLSVTYNGESHAVRNEKDAPLIILAAIIPE